MRLLIDNREPNNLIQEIMILNQETCYNIEVQQLDIGDFWFCSDDSNQPIVILERKSLQDLEMSIKDGRYNEQSARLSSIDVHNHNIYYIVEGSIINYKKQEKVQTLRSTITSLTYYKGFSVLNTLNTIDTAGTVYSFFDKLMRETKRVPYYSLQQQTVNHSLETSSNLVNNDIEYIKTLKNQKKNQITQDNILAIMLNQIPGLSSVSSIAITQRYKTMTDLLYSLKNEPEKIGEIYLDNGRRISKTVVQNLKKYLIPKD